MYFRTSLIAFALIAIGTVANAQEVPDSQKEFVAAIAAARDTYEKAANDLQKSTARKTRAKALCEIVGKGKIEGWVGEVYDLTTNGDGNGVFTVELEGEVWVGTYNNSLSDIGADTLIPADSELFAALSTLATGQKVVFNGKFLKDGDAPDCLKEKSLTEAGAMGEPEFLMQFSDVKQAE